jgi:hypothetical protein
MGLDAVELDGPASDLALVPGGGSAAVVPAPGLEVGRVGLYRPWQSNMDEGWLRWILDHYGVPHTELRNERIVAGSLAQDFDVIVLPSLNARSLLEGNSPQRVPPEYAGGIGDEGLEALKSFVREGGTLFFHDGAAAMAVEAFQLPLREVSGEAREAGFYAPGSILRFAWNPESELVGGMDPDGVAFVSSRASLFEITGSGGGEVGEPRVLGAFPEEGELLLSGYLEGEDAIRGKSAAVEVPYGAGRLILVGFSLHNRAQMVANFPLLLTALRR